MAIVTKKVEQSELERFQRLCERLVIATQESPFGPSWDEKERVERNVHPHLLSIIDELIEARAALSTTSSGDAPLAALIERLGKAKALVVAGQEEADKSYENDGYEMLYNAADEVRSCLTQAIKALSAATPPAETPASVPTTSGAAAEAVGSSALKGWVSVADRMPEPKPSLDYSTRVLAYGDGGIDGPHFVAYCDLYGNWYLAHDNQPKMKVTHWQPLPTPPQA